VESSHFSKSIGGNEPLCFALAYGANKAYARFCETVKESHEVDESLAKDLLELFPDQWTVVSGKGGSILVKKEGSQELALRTERDQVALKLPKGFDERPNDGKKSPNESLTAKLLSQYHKILRPEIIRFFQKNPKQRGESVKAWAERIKAVENAIMPDFLARCISRVSEEDIRLLCSLLPKTDKFIARQQGDYSFELYNVQTGERAVEFASGQAELFGKYMSRVLAPELVENFVVLLEKAKSDPHKEDLVRDWISLHGHLYTDE
jgi:hypothetical protein